MSDFLKKILWVTDFSDEAQEALVYADIFARTFTAELLALHVVPDFSPALYNTATAIKGELVRRVDVIKKDAEEHLSSISKAKDVSYRSLVMEGNSAKKIIEAAEEEDVDLIVMGRKGMTALERIFIGSVANQVLRNSKVPLLLTKKRNGEPSFKKILVPTDFSQHEEVERDFAWKLAKGLDAMLTLLHVLELHDYEFSPRVLEEMMEEILKRIKRRKRREKEDVEVTEEVIRAVNAALGIVDYAETHDYDLIVISTCGPGAVERFFLGSTTEKVISNSPIPIFAIPSQFCKI
jgi:nucleotide-binding universal stress UspA family protein